MIAWQREMDAAMARSAGVETSWAQCRTVCAVLGKAHGDAFGADIIGQRNQQDLWRHLSTMIAVC